MPPKPLLPVLLTPTGRAMASASRQLFQSNRTGTDLAVSGEPEFGSPPASTQPPPAPPQLEDPLSDDIAPPQIVVVSTASELQAAAADAAQDIEIRSHLDLRPLSRPKNPDIPGFHSDDPANEIRLALLYVHGGMRSMRVRTMGRCVEHA